MTHTYVSYDMTLKIFLWLLLLLIAIRWYKIMDFDVVNWCFIHFSVFDDVLGKMMRSSRSFWWTNHFYVMKILWVAQWPFTPTLWYSYLHINFTCKIILYDNIIRYFMKIWTKSTYWSTVITVIHRFMLSSACCTSAS